MVDEVNRLVGNLLAGGKEVFLPGVGTLYTERRPARRLSKRTVEPPCRVVAFSSQERGLSLPQAIASAAGCGTEEAQDIYVRWLGHVREENLLTLEGVGVLKFKNFTPDPAFDARLNPQGHAPVSIPRRRPDWTVWVGVAAILIALVIGGNEFLMLYPDGEPLGTERTLSDEAQAPVSQPDALSVAEPAQPLSDEAAPNASSPAAEIPTDPSADASASGENPALEPSPAAPAPAPQPKTATSETPAKLVSGRYYVVLGVFSTPENAARAVAEAVKKAPYLGYGVYHFGDKYMVAALEAADPDVCAAFIRERSATFPDLWTYRAR